MDINHGMIPFFLPMGDTKDGTLRLQYGPVNHNQISWNTALEIANNLAGNPMDFYSGHQSGVDGQPKKKDKLVVSINRCTHNPRLRTKEEQ